MIQIFIFMFALVGGLHTPLNDDKISAELQKSKDEYEKTLGKIRESFVKSLDRAERKARKAGNAGAVDAILAAKSDFERYQKFPKDQTKFLVAAFDAKMKLEKAYEEAIRDFLKDGKDEEREKASDALERFRDETEPFQVGSKWKGTHRFWSTDKSLKPFEGPVTVIVKEWNSEGVVFRAELNAQRAWRIEFKAVGNTFVASKLELVTTQNDFGAAKGERKILASDFGFDGATLTFMVTRQENEHGASLKFIVRETE